MQLEHGKSTIKVDGSCIYVELLGSFNSEGAQAYIDKITPVIESFEDAPLVMLVNLNEFAGATPDAYEKMEAYNAWSLNKPNFLAKAMFAKSRPSQTITQSQAPSYKIEKASFFTDIDKAESWIKSFLK